MAFPRSIVAILLLACWLSPLAVRAQTIPPVYAALFTHIEDNTPAGTLGSSQSRQNYLLYRNALISMGTLARDRGVSWSLEPDWKILRAALLYEDATLTGNTSGKNFLRYLKEDLGVVIDPHSHENGGYNYTDVAYLLDSLGVGGSTVIGGHIWDPSYAQFQEWDRFRVPVPGEMFPRALWRGDILMGSGTPNHVNDPVVSGAWRPRDRDHYFEDDPAGNIMAVGQYKGTLSGVSELRDLYRAGIVPTDVMLTSSFHIKPSTIIAPGGISEIDDTVITPIVAMRDSGAVVVTDFTQLVLAWQTAFGSRGYLYTAQAVVGVDPILDRELSLGWCSPNPFSSETIISYSVSHAIRVRIEVFDVLGRWRAQLLDEPKTPGRYSIRWKARGLANGTYFCRLQEVARDEQVGAVMSRKLVIAR